jgi:hypothetical protein
VTTKKSTTLKKEPKIRRPVLVKEINKEHTRKAEARKAPARMTVADLIKDEMVPMAVRLWLEDFTERGEKALAHAWVEQEQDTLDLARLILDVLDSAGKETDKREFPEEARDYIEEYLFRLCRASELNIWNLGVAAVAALPTLLDCAANSIEGNPNYIAVESAISRLTTPDERREFLTGPRWGRNDEDETNTEAAFKLSRVLADPRTPRETRDELELLIREFSMSSRVSVEHPALVKRAFLTHVRGETATGPGEERPSGDEERPAQAARAARLNR